MSALYAVELTDAELDVVRLALGRMLDPKPVKAKAAPRAVRSHVAPVFATGNDALDAFMRRSWKPSDRAAAEKRYAAGLKQDPPLKPRKWTKQDHAVVRAFNEFAVAAWRRLGHKVVVSGKNGIDPDGSNVRVLPLPSK